MADYGATGGNAVEMYDGSILTFGNFVRAGSEGFFTSVGTTLDVTYPSLDNSLAFQESGYSSEKALNATGGKGGIGAIVIQFLG